MSETRPLSAAELEQLYLPGKRTELVRGLLAVREPAGYSHGVISLRIGRLLAEYVEGRHLGHVVAAETGFRIFSNPDTVRAADAAFIARHRVPERPPAGFAALAPDLAVEVLSPQDRPGDVLAKVADWLTAGTRLVWVLDPAREQARVYRADGTESVLTAPAALEGEDVVPGFHASLAALLSLSSS